MQYQLLTEEIKHFIHNKIWIIVIVFLFIILAYGYYITTWSISIDSEYIALFKQPLLGWVAQTRVICALFDILTNYTVIPFFYNFLSIFFLALSSIIWAVIIDKILKPNNIALLIFLLLYNISPFYVFILQFTVCNLHLFFAMFVVSLVAYSTSRNISNQATKPYYITNILLLFTAVSLYEMLVVYYLSAIIFLFILHSLQKKHTNHLKKYTYVLKIIFPALIVYKIIPTIVMRAMHIKNTGYKNHMIQWGRSIEHITFSFFRILHYVEFMFKNYYSLTLGVIFLVIVSIIYLKKYHSKSAYVLIAATALLFISPFFLIILSGYPMPLRTMNTTPLAIAGIGFVLYHLVKTATIRKIMIGVVLMLTFFQALQINQLFFSDHMRLQYDIAFANTIYSRLLDTVGGKIKSIPVAIVGSHKYKEKAFTVKPPYSNSDPISYSFFEWDEGDYYRIYKFMQWNGNDFIFADQSKFELAVQLSQNMPSFPDQKSILVTPNLIVMKIS